MSKQNEINLKYILLASPQHKSLHEIQSIKKASLHKKNQQNLEKKPLPKHGFVKNKAANQMFKSMSKELVSEIEVVRSDLSECMNAINTQSQKNSIFKKLITILQSQMKQMEESEKRLKEVENEQNLKKAHKIQYDIEQILQKYNEEIAKINCLKEQTDAARTDRVVFSNLFKKIEGEIKQCEENYKEFITKTQLNRQKRAQKQLKQAELNKQESIDEIEIKDDNRNSINKIGSKQVFNSESRLFVTTLQDRMLALNKKVSHRGAILNESIPSQSKRLKFRTEEVQTKIEKIAKTVECFSCEEAIVYYSKVEDQNLKLSGLIEGEDRKIEFIEEQIEKLKQERRISEISDSGQSQPSSNSSKTIRMNTIVTEESQKDDGLQIIIQIFDQLGIAHEKSIDYLLSNEETLSVLENEIECLCNAQKFKKTEPNICSSKSVEHDLDKILSKMQKFDSCDRILNKKQFYCEYTKQVNKSKRNLKYKK